MALTVVVRSGDLKTPAEITFDTPRVVIGRSEGCEVELPDPSVSHRHTSIRQRGTEYVILDEGSTNGTFVGQVRLSPQAPRLLRSGDLVRVGRVWLECRIEQVPTTQNHKLMTREIALGLVASALTADGRPAGARVSVSAGPDAGASFVLSSEAERTYVVGRGPGLESVAQRRRAVAAPPRNRPPRAQPQCARLEIEEWRDAGRHAARARQGNGLAARGDTQNR